MKEHQRINEGLKFPPKVNGLIQARNLSTESFNDAAKAFVQKYPAEIMKDATELLGKLIQAQTDSTDAEWVRALANVPGVTPHLAVKIWEAKEHPESLEYPSQSIDPITGLAANTTTPVEDLHAMNDEGMTKHSLAQTNLNNVKRDLDADSFTLEQRAEIDFALDRSRAVAEGATDKLWVESLLSHPNIDEKSVVEVWTDKENARSKFNNQWNPNDDEEQK